MSHPSGSYPITVSIGSDFILSWNYEFHCDTSKPSSENDVSDKESEG
ncbi:1699_t:CDS:2 [Dentiscutata heterogama]|uniref:1699_t:CDS:1 n=1 Tax=Dentiscutata heterogama TaxID=1316150 RepID=A0ACA9LS85_9GLOM|nr:1699_t:CDS:2 [Dentiscutata heterogama]